MVILELDLSVSSVANPRMATISGDAEYLRHRQTFGAGREASGLAETTEKTARIPAVASG